MKTPSLNLTQSRSLSDHPSARPSSESSRQSKSDSFSTALKGAARPPREARQADAPDKPAQNSRTPRKTNASRQGAESESSPVRSESVAEESPAVDAADADQTADNRKSDPDVAPDSSVPGRPSERSAQPAVDQSATLPGVNTVNGIDAGPVIQTSATPTATQDTLADPGASSRQNLPSITATAVPAPVLSTNANPGKEVRRNAAAPGAVSGSKRQAVGNPEPEAPAQPKASADVPRAAAQLNPSSEPPRVDSHSPNSVAPAAPESLDAALPASTPNSAPHQTVPLPVAMSVSTAQPGAAHAPALPAPPPAPASGLSEAPIVRSALAVHRVGGGAMTIKLEPEHLGSMRINLRLEGDRLSLDFQADNPQARHLLSDSMDSLRRALADEGLRVDAVTVQPLTRHGESSSSNSFAESRSQSQSQQESTRQDAGHGQSRGRQQQDSSSADSGRDQRAAAANPKSRRFSLPSAGAAQPRRSAA